MVRMLVSAILALGVSSSAFAVDKAYFEIKKMKVSEVPVSASSDVMAESNLQQCETTPNRNFVISRTGDPLNLSPLDDLQVWVDQIINIGKKIWTIVEAGKPVVNVKLDTANALPRGVKCWMDMQGWAVPQVKAYRVQYENAYGMNVVDFTYRVSFIANGNVDGVGKYITNATFIPSDISVAWGFKFDAAASIPMVLNQGSKQDPVAGMQMNMQWKVDSPLMHQESTQSYFVTGDNKLIEMK